MRQSNRKLEFDGIYCIQKYFSKDETFVNYN